MNFFWRRPVFPYRKLKLLFNLTLQVIERSLSLKPMDDVFKSQYVTFVCTGNTCRSPMAEKLFLHAIQAEKPPINQLKAISTGISAYEGDFASPNALKVLKDCGLSLNDHRSQLLTQKIIDQSLVIFCMTEIHRRIILQDFKINDSPIYLMREFMSSTSNKDIPDPFGQSLEVYKACRDNLVEAIPSIINFLKNIKK